MAKRIELELLEGKHKPQQIDETVDEAIAEFAEHIRLSNRRPGTLSGYQTTLTTFRKFLKGTRVVRLRDLTPQLIVGFIQSRKELSPNTVLGDIKRLRCAFRRAARRGAIASNPFSHPDVRSCTPSAIRHERTFTDTELETFLDGAMTVTVSPQAREYRDMFLFLAETGLRVGEALHQRWCDIHLDPNGESYLRVEPHGDWAPKSKSSVRTVPLSARVEAMLRGYLAEADTIDITARIFPTSWTPENGNVGQQFRRVRDRLDMGTPDGKGQKLRVHSFRHYYASRLVRMGVDCAAVRDLLGHTSVAITNVYFTVPRDELFRAVHGAFNENVTKNVPDAVRQYTSVYASVRNSADQR